MHFKISSAICFEFGPVYNLRSGNGLMNCTMCSHFIFFPSFLQLLESFIEEYFDQNPISQLGIIVTKNKRGEKITELGGKVFVLLS